MSVIVTADEVLSRGLVLAGFNSARNDNVKRETNLERFRALYGSNPCVYAQIWEDLQNTNNPEARIDATNKRIANLDRFMMTIHFFKCYPTEAQLAATFNVCEKSARTACWFYAKKVQALKTEKIVWPEHWAPGSLNIPTFLLSVDGIHCRIEEPMHPTKSKDKSYYSHKFNQAGLAYELGIAAYENRLVWVNGPFRASRHDVTILRRCGLKDKIPEGHKVIGDNGYVGEKLVVSTPNAHDPRALRKFKSRARARHESFNGRIKKFRCLDDRFRHSMYKHKIVFEAICVICQYQLENGSPLFDV